MTTYRERIAFARERLGVSIAADEYELKVLRARIADMEAALTVIRNMTYYKAISNRTDVTQLAYAVYQKARDAADEGAEEEP